jgi:hypothetical protein
MNGPWPPRGSESEERRRLCTLMYDFEVEIRKLGRGWGDAALVHYPDKELFRFHDGRFAFSREHADWALLRKRGRMKEL